jgi:molecular chaperone HscC
MSQPLIGIDLGTTHSVVAVFEEGGPRALVDGAGHSLIPSVVAEDERGAVLVGRAAWERLAHSPSSVATRFKPDMGQEEPLAVGQQKLTPVALSALVLKDVVALAEERLGQTIDQAVITVPAWFREPQRQATVEAARLAGLKVSRLINEPTAAALAHGLHLDDEPRQVVVFDLGGGTFDVSVLEFFDGVVDVRASVGDVNLGGEDFTDALADHLASLVGELNAQDRARLWLSADRAKVSLSAQLATVVDLTPWGGEPGIRVTRAEFQRVARPLLDRIMRTTRDAVAQARSGSGDIDAILLVGGATRMPMIQTLIQQLFGKPPESASDVDRIVALGAAVQAALLARHHSVSECAVTDVLTHSLGVRSSVQIREQFFDDRFSVLLPRGSALPISRVEGFTTLHQEQRSVRLRVYEGEHRNASRNTLLGELEVGELPVDETQEECLSFEVRFTHDVSGLLEVEVHIPSTGEKRTLLLQRGKGGLDERALADAAAALQRLKTHPRDQLPNRWLVERATRVVELMAGDERNWLDHELFDFEAVLNTGDRAQIATAASHLRECVESVIRSHGLELD